MAQHNTLKALFKRILLGRAQEQEKTLFDRWYNQLDLSAGAAFGSPEEEQAVMHRMQDSLRKHADGVKPSGHKQSPWRWVAAAAIVFLATATSLLYFLKSTVPQTMYTVVATADNTLKKITLADGSIVTLNSGSELAWAKDAFNQRERRVRLVGEGFFEVKRDEIRPFIVETDSLETTVLGTTFNIESYPGEDQIKVSLLAGSVKVNATGESERSALLKPGEMAEYTRGISVMQVKPIAADHVDVWIRGGLVFNEIALPYALDRLAQRYKLDIVYNREQLEGKTVTASFERVGWEESLKAVLFAHGLDYTVSNGVVYVNE
ncbi:FecR family protein [Parapedobacter koreensis]|uniref:FecR family protein n=1 Tax=Parapedobacter koreensis TaxID=332977 RepID=A0A1H7FKX3_9SPHI|nr:FecR family protein [Parapedobacter koreensis]SEK26639.1 FecR family protein [Parapedobacter koreensis]